MTCSLCEAIKSEAEEVWIAPAYEGHTDFEILKTKAMKGHKFRYMIVSRVHMDNVGGQAWRYAAGRLIEFMMEKCDEDFVVMYPDHATIKDHFHLVACDIADGDDLEQIQNTKRFEVYFRGAGKKFADEENW
jgi:hypothetical protein